MSPGVGEWAMLKNRRECRESDTRNGVAARATRPDAELDLDAVRTGIGAAIRTIHSAVLREEVPDRIAELLRQLDQQNDASGA